MSQNNDKKFYTRYDNSKIYRHRNSRVFKLINKVQAFSSSSYWVLRTALVMVKCRVFSVINNLRRSYWVGTIPGATQKTRQYWFRRTDTRTSLNLMSVPNNSLIIEQFWHKSPTWMTDKHDFECNALRGNGSTHICQ